MITARERICRRLLAGHIEKNVFVVTDIARNVPLMAIFRRVAPLLTRNFKVLALRIAFPPVVLWLPRTMLGP